MAGLVTKHKYHIKPKNAQKKTSKEKIKDAISMIKIMGIKIIKTDENK